MSASSVTVLCGAVHPKMGHLLQVYYLQGGLWCPLPAWLKHDTTNLWVYHTASFLLSRGTSWQLTSACFIMQVVSFWKTSLSLVSLLGGWNCDNKICVRDLSVYLDCYIYCFSGLGLYLAVISVPSTLAGLLAMPLCWLQIECNGLWHIGLLLLCCAFNKAAFSACLMSHSKSLPSL